MTSPTTSPEPAAAPRPVPTALNDRALAPDLARGGLLLFIVIANASWYLWAGTSRDLSGWPVEASELDRVVQTLSLIAIDGRSYPMFAALFGYGLWQLYSRVTATGAEPRAAAWLLQRRHLWMLVFGFVHAALLWAGDIIGAYGLAGLVIVWLFLRRRDRTLITWAIVFASLLVVIAVLTAVAGLSGLFGSDGDGSYSSEETGLGISTAFYPASILERVVAWGPSTLLSGLVLVVPAAILVGILLARHRVLEEPGRHLPLLRTLATVGIAVGWAGGAVTAAQNAELLGIGSSVDWAFTFAHMATGLAGGLGYVAAFGLIAHALRTPGPVAQAIRALGSRSLTFYLAQSVLFAPVMSAWGLGLGAWFTSWSIVAYAVVVWAVSVAIAGALERRGIRGPAEVLLRKLTYRAKRSTIAP